jgi:hypothetical protein
MIWLLRLKQKWVLPFLSTAGFALLLLVYDLMPISNTTLGWLSCGTILLGFVLGCSAWIYLRLSEK